MNFYDILLARCLCCKEGSEAEPLNVTENGQYIAPEGKAFNPVIVNVPLPYGTLPIIENGIYNVYSYASVNVDVAGGGGITADEVALRTISGAITGSSASYIGSYAFYGCSSLTEVSFPACTSIAASAFQNCISLTEVSFPVCTSIGSSIFQNCSSLTEVSFPVCKSIGASAFRNCYNLLSFNLVGVSSVPTLGVSVFLSTPIGGYTGSTGGVYGSVYVPSSLLTAFQTAPNWSLISSRIVGV